MEWLSGDQEQERTVPAWDHLRKNKYPANFFLNKHRKLKSNCIRKVTPWKNCKPAGSGSFARKSKRSPLQIRDTVFRGEREIFQKIVLRALIDMDLSISNESHRS